MPHQPSTHHRYFLFWLIAAALIFTTSFAMAMPKTISYGGYLTGSEGEPINDTLKIGISIFDAETYGNLLWEEFSTADVEDGYFVVRLGTEEALPIEIFHADVLFIEVTIEEEVLEPRTQIDAVPFAMASLEVIGDINPSSISIGNQLVIDEFGNWVGSTEGFEGLQGPEGVQGPEGPQGPVGPVGPAGPTGATGAAGSQGPQGPAGATGPAGPAGPTGATGADGAQGPQGPAGATGPAGSAGPTGATGADGAQGPQGPQGIEGPEGPQGPAGSGASALIYGDGSAGSLTIGSVTDWTTAFPGSYNFQYTDVIVNANWTVPSGTVIRCTGQFTVSNGSEITVDYGLPLKDGDPERGLSKQAPLGYDLGGIGLSEIEAASILRPGVIAGGTGNDGFTGADGGAGGGSFSVRAQGAISVVGTITSNGGDSPITTSASGSGGGGGGGGFIILASQTSVVNSGTINANGGNGSNALGTNNAGGGGGGGIVHMLAPNITQGTVSASGGSPGGNITAGDTSSSGAGGALGGDGGRGSHDEGAADGWTAESGGDGHIITTTVTNPENLFF